MLVVFCLATVRDGCDGSTYGLSTTKTSDSSRRPRARPLATSSFFLVSPRPSAFPINCKSAGIRAYYPFLYFPLHRPHLVHVVHPSACLVVPALKHKILTWLPVSGRASASTVGAKNMASSSGCAISRHTRFSSSSGKRLRTALAVQM